MPGLCNKFKHSGTPLWSNSTLSHERWIYRYIKLRLGVSRSHSVRAKLTVLNVKHLLIIKSSNSRILQEVT